MKVTTALLSVSDKTGIAAFARGLVNLGVRILSTGGSAQLLRDVGILVQDVSDYTGQPEMLDGRVKTLHPKIHAGILARRDMPAHREALQRGGMAPIDLVVVNLYPFLQTIARPDCTLPEAMEMVDIGGPTMIRGAAKNHHDVGVITDPEDYEAILAELQANAGGLSLATRRRLAHKAFCHTARYDGAIADYLGREDGGGQGEADKIFGRSLHLAFDRWQDLRYGENAHQQAAFYVTSERPLPSGLAMVEQLQGKALSYNNLSDADAAWQCVSSMHKIDPTRAACAIIKHNNPCGAAMAETLSLAYQRAFCCDKQSAFGGIIALNDLVDEETATQLLGEFVEVILAPDFTPAALAAIAKKPNIRVLKMPLGTLSTHKELRGVSGGILVQTPDHVHSTRASCRIVTKRQPTDVEWRDLLFAECIAKHVKSNAVVFCVSERTVGIGAGQMSRVDSIYIAKEKAQREGLSLERSIVASDAFFPFRDSVDALAAIGVAAILQPGGSIRDQEVIAAADEHGIAMVMSDVRHFRH